MFKRTLFVVSMLVGPIGFASSKVSIGEAAPDFSLPDQDGKIHTLSEQRGKYVVLEWWNKDCPFVVAHYTPLDEDPGLGNMQTLQRKSAGKSLEAATKKTGKKGEKNQAGSSLIENEVVWFTMLSSAPGKQGYLEGEGIKEAMKEVRGKPTAVLRDPDGKVGKSYGALTTPHMYIIDPEGVLVYMGAIDSVVSRGVSTIKGANNYVRNAFAQLGAGQAVNPSVTQPYGCSIKY